MPEALSPWFRLKIWGEYACFSRPENKVERVSYPIITPSAARGVIESILWKPQIAWRIGQIDRLRVPVFQQVRRNEVMSKASVDRSAMVIDETRQQRGILSQNTRQCSNGGRVPASASSVPVSAHASSLLSLGC